MRTLILSVGYRVLYSLSYRGAQPVAQRLQPLQALHQSRAAQPRLPRRLALKGDQCCPPRTVSTLQPYCRSQCHCTGGGGGAGAYSAVRRRAAEALATREGQAPAAEA
jgi:hypothetical protein